MLRYKGNEAYYIVEKMKYFSKKVMHMDSHMKFMN